ncbi:MAG: hypothetical protein Q8O89_07305 [Nanoarchaeota archaeon]|nr:hypothetical protein [Nanoarchaeota archaeon]
MVKSLTDDEIALLGSFKDKPVSLFFYLKHHAYSDDDDCDVTHSSETFERKTIILDALHGYELDGQVYPAVIFGKEQVHRFLFQSDSSGRFSSLYSHIYGITSENGTINPDAYSIVLPNADLTGKVLFENRDYDNCQLDKLATKHLIKQGIDLGKIFELGQGEEILKYHARIDQFFKEHYTKIV